MYLGWCWEESPSDSFIQLYGGESQGFSKWLQLFRKLLQLFLDHGAINAPDLGLLKEQRRKTIMGRQSPEQRQSVYLFFH